ncbi:hypothetical protein [uncultured Legionella sp.]|uniref:hypothetical protein n=1 Tax=uncultured Legionella sp. TaxID=210934 RepID=UPI00263021CE|nr:hypothetical protein [uncultured Legionella sp.]
MLVIKQKITLLLLLLPLLAYAENLTNPYMIPIKINMQDCIKENTKDCLRSTCIASPASCHSECAANSSDKCKMLSRQTIYDD